MTSFKRPPHAPPPVADWLSRQAPAVRQAIVASVDFETDTVRDAGIGEPATGVVECLRGMAQLDVAPPSGRYVKLAHDLLDKAGALAFALGVTHFRSENELQAFLSLAGTALLGDPAAIERFETGLSLDSDIDTVIMYLQAELEMLDGGFPGE